MGDYLCEKEREAKKGSTCKLENTKEKNQSRNTLERGNRHKRKKRRKYHVEEKLAITINLE